MLVHGFVDPVMRSEFDTEKLLRSWFPLIWISLLCTWAFLVLVHVARETRIALCRMRPSSMRGRMRPQF